MKKGLIIGFGALLTGSMTLQSCKKESITPCATPGQNDSIPGNGNDTIGSGGNGNDTTWNGGNPGGGGNGADTTWTGGNGNGTDTTWTGGNPGDSLPG